MTCSIRTLKYRCTNFVTPCKLVRPIKGIKDLYIRSNDIRKAEDEGPGSKKGNTEDVDFDTYWAVLSSSLQEIHTKNASSLSFEELYRNAYKLVLKKKGEPLYLNVTAFEKRWLIDVIRPRILAALSPSLLNRHGVADSTSAIEKRGAGELLLKSLKIAWDDHLLCMNMTTDVLMYMERVYCTDNQKPSIFIASMAQFRDYVLRAAIPSHNDLTVAMVLNSVILEQIRMEREGDFIDTALIRSCIYMLEGLYETEEEKSTKLYLTCFEPEYLVASQEFYASEGSSILANADAGTFCRHAKKRANEEQDRCRSTLSTLTLPKIKVIVENELIRRNIREVINLEVSGVKFMLDNDRLNELEMVYDLISRVDPKKEDLQKAVQARIIELGTELNTSAINASRASSTKPPKTLPKPDSDRPDGETKAPAEKPLGIQTAAAIKWIDDVLQLKEKYDNVLAKAFQSDQGFHAAFSRSFTEFINAFERSSEYLSLFFDENLKKGIKGKTENEVDLLIDKGITLLQYIQDKDMFERYYKKHLSKRLLMKRSISTDGERQMISKMKMTVGNSFTQKIENMFNDIAMSEDLTSSYKRHISQLGDADPKRVELDVNVLTSTMWPLEIMTPNYEDWQTSRLLPPQIERIKHGFEKFYLDQHSGRKLMWQPSMGTADMRGYFPEMKGTKKTRELNVSTYAMVILMLYNDLPPGESLTCEEIQAKTNIPLNDLKRNLQSLAVAQKSRVLLKDPMSKDVKNEDRFFFNEKFFSQFQRVKIGVVTSGNNVEDIDERAETEKKNDATRGGTVEAAIVRIMKQRKELSHQGLISEVIQQLTPRFMPDVNMVKKRIESLLEREYLERIEGAERPAYRYMA